MPEPEYRVCTICKQTKSRFNFERHANTGEPVCIQCRKQYAQGQRSGEGKKA